jgi:hypothetical protein
LFRIILLEQIYRSFKILNNEQYHKWYCFFTLLYRYTRKKHTILNP